MIGRVGQSTLSFAILESKLLLIVYKLFCVEFAGLDSYPKVKIRTSSKSEASKSCGQKTLAFDGLAVGGGSTVLLASAVWVVDRSFWEPEALLAISDEALFFLKRLLSRLLALSLIDASFERRGSAEALGSCSSEDQVALLCPPRPWTKTRLVEDQNRLPKSRGNRLRYSSKGLLPPLLMMVIP